MGISMDKLKIGVIGCGTVAGYGHIPAVTRSELTELVAVVDVNPEKARKTAGKYGVKHYSSYKEFLECEDVDAVIIATPTFTHKEIAVAAFKAGKHVLCEKPIALSLEEADEMIKAAEVNNCVFMIGFTRRFSPKYRKIKELLDRGEIGELKYVKQIVNWSGPIWAGLERYSWMINIGGGPLIDEGVHEADVLRWYTGREASTVYAEALWFKPSIKYPDHVNVLVKMDNGVLGYIELSWAYPKAENTLQLIGTDGMISGEDKIFLYRGKEKTVFETDDDRNNFLRELEHFVECIVKGIRPAASGYEGRAALEITLAALKSIKEKKPVRLPIR